MAQTVADFLVRRLQEWGVKRIFAYPGDGSNGIMGALGRARDKIDYVQTRHNEVTWEQRILEGDPKFSASQDVPDFPYAEYARSLGLAGTRVDDPEAVGPAWDEALAADRPVVLDMVTDPNALPPHVTLPQRRNYLAALLWRDADAAAIVKATAREWWAGTFPERAEH